jgi:hypothetical protein
LETHSSSERPQWLFSRRADFWLASGGASLGLLAAVLLILWHGDRELDGLDLILSEFRLGATYVAFSSGYALGASNASFLLVLAVHHEVQYLYFTYAMARHRGSFYAASQTGAEAKKDLDAYPSCKDGGALRTEAGHATSFLGGRLSVWREQLSAVGPNSNG